MKHFVKHKFICKLLKYQNIKKKILMYENCIIHEIKQNSIKNKFFFKSFLIHPAMNLCFLILSHIFLVYISIFFYIFKVLERERREKERFSVLYFLFYLIFNEKLKMIVAILAYWIWLRKGIFEFSGC